MKSPCRDRPSDLGIAQSVARQSDGYRRSYFYDAIAPIIDASTIDMDSAFLANRYDKGEEEAYLNCPMNEAEYCAFIDALMAAEKVPPKAFEKEKFFQGCQPIEAIAATGRDSLRFGPMKPVGLEDPKPGAELLRLCSSDPKTDRERPTI